MSALLLKALLSYLLGSVIGSLVIGRIRGVDIRKLGSGNPGATNALRTQGLKVGLMVFAIDVFKGWFATAVACRLAAVPRPAAGSGAFAPGLRRCAASR